MRGRRLTEQQVGQLREWKAEGRTNKELAAWLVCSESMVTYYCQRHGIPTDRLAGVRSGHQQFALKLIEHEALGASEICDALGVTTSNAWRVLTALRRKGLAHVAEWSSGTGTRPMARYRAGPGEDAPYPRRRPSPSRTKAHRDRVRREAKESGLRKIRKPDAMGGGFWY